MDQQTEPTPAQFELVAGYLQCEAEARNLVGVMAWSETPEEIKEHYRAFARAAWEGFKEGPEVAQAFVEVRAKLFVGATS